MKTHVNKRVRVPTKTIWLGLILSLPSLSYGAYSNYNSVLIGERAAGLGGAFTALSGDPAATAFYNPATTVLMEGSSFSANVNVYNKYETTIGEGGSSVDEAPQRLNRGFFRSLPAASGTVLHFKSFAIGVSILVPDYDFYSGQLNGGSDATSFLSYVDESLWVGGTFSGKLTSKDRVGLSLYYTARNLSRSSSDRLTTGGGSGAVITSEEKNLTANSIVSVFGYHRQLSPSWSIGVSYRPPSLPIAGEASYYLATTVTDPYSTTTLNRGNLRAVTKVPSKFALGFAREEKGFNTISFDVQIYEGTSYRDLPELPEGTDLIDHRHVANFAVGYEQILRENLTLRLGFYTNLSSHTAPDLSRGVRQGDHVDMSGFSANFQVLTKNHTSFTFGGYYSGGRGTTTQRVAQNLSQVPKAQQVFTMLVGTGFAF